MSKSIIVPMVQFASALNKAFTEVRVWLQFARTSQGTTVFMYVLEKPFCLGLAIPGLVSEPSPKLSTSSPQAAMVLQLFAFPNYLVSPLE